MSALISSHIRDVAGFARRCVRVTALAALCALAVSLLVALWVAGASTTEAAPPVCASTADIELADMEIKPWHEPKEES